MTNDNAAHWLSLGNALYAQRRWDQAADAFRQSLAFNPHDPLAWNNLASAELKLGKLAAAQEAYERTLQLAPGHIGVLANYVYLLDKRGERNQARSLLNRLLSQSSLNADGYALVGYVAQVIGDWQQAATACGQALALAPHHRLARHNLILALQGQGLLAPAEAEARQFVASDPQYPDAWSLLGGILKNQAQVDDSLAALRRAVELEPSPERHSRLLCAMPYAQSATAADLLAAHRQWNAAYTPPSSSAGTKKGPGRVAAGNPLRLGIVSADFGQHPTAFMVLPVLESLDKCRCYVVCYSDRTVEDQYTARFRAAADLWRPASGLSSSELADQIQQDQIDVLIDLMGHTGNRLLTFAHKPAPLQLSWFGYVGTTGLEAMDCLLADRFHVREGEEPWYAEKILRMPHGYACYQPPADAPEVGSLPALECCERPPQAAFTFGSFNNPAKFSPSTLAAWAEILERAAHSRLLLKYAGLDQPELQDRLRAPFAERGIDLDRILMEGFSPHLELLAAYNRVDIGLDTLPYSGGVTTCEALWMGVPVITFPGQTFAGRHATSHLTNAGYEQFIAADWQGYIELAVQWANRLDELALLRSQMRDRVRQSPLCDAKRFASDLLNLLQTISHNESISNE